MAISNVLKWFKSYVCFYVFIRYDRPEDESAKVQRGQNGERERDPTAALQRIGHAGGNRESGCKYQAFSTLNLLSISSPTVCLSTAQWVGRQGHHDGRRPAGELHGDSRHRARWEPYRKRPATLEHNVSVIPINSWALVKAICGPWDQLKIYPKRTMC